MNNKIAHVLEKNEVITNILGEIFLTNMIDSSNFFKNSALVW